MKFLIGISHPKQVHMFKNMISAFKKKGHSCCVVVNEKEFTGKLLDACGIEYIKIGINQRGVFRKSVQLFVLTLKTLLIGLRFKPDLIFGQVVPHIAYTAFLLRKPFVVFEDTETAKTLHKIVHPFARAVVTPNSFKKNLGSKQVIIRGGFELAYLHEEYFQPAEDIYEYLNLEPGERFVILRFVSWQALHDIGHKGISVKNKIKAVQEFEQYARVFISSEGPLPEELEPYRYAISPSLMHHALYYADLVYGESSSMAAEAAYLGSPAVYLDNEGRGYTDYLEKHYKLVFNYSESLEDQDRSIAKGIEILNMADRKIWMSRSKVLLEDSIDVNAFMAWFIEKYPESHIIMVENPAYQERFN